MPQAQPNGIHIFATGAVIRCAMLTASLLQIGPAMRLAPALPFALLLAVAVSAPAATQQAKPSQPKPSPSKQNQPSQANPAAQPAPAAAKPSPEEELLHQRILLRERFNKGWDIQPEDARSRAARCKAEARKRYSAVHPIKRRKYVKNCTAGAHH
jgi:hypothetical protein